jgi:hypothetical protein
MFPPVLAVDHLPRNTRHHLLARLGTLILLHACMSHLDMRTILQVCKPRVCCRALGVVQEADRQPRRKMDEPHLQAGLMAPMSVIEGRSGERASAGPSPCRAKLGK